MSQVDIKASIIENRILSFKLSESLSESKKIICYSRGGEVSELTRKIFDQKLVDEVCLGPREVRVKLSQAMQDWHGLAKEIGQVIRSNFASQKALSQELAREEALKENSPEAVLNAKVQELVEEQINPALAGHGGSVEVTKIEEGVAYLNFKGGCQGCSQVSVTVKSGIERMLKERIPEIKGVKDITEHELGTNPYFT